MKVLFTSRAFNNIAGGVEHMAAIMMNEMRRRGIDIGLLTLDPPDAQSYYPLDPSIEWTKISIGDPKIAASWPIRFARQRALRQAVRNSAPDVIIAFQSGAFTAIRTATLGLGIPVIAAERNSPAHYDFYPKGPQHRRIANLAFLGAARIAIQLESYRKKYPSILANRIVTIPNPVSPVSEQASFSEREPIILHVGRLSDQKNQALLLEAFNAVASAFPEWRLVLIGDGENAEKLRAHTDRLPSKDRIQFLGAVKNVAPWYRRAGILAFPSLWEGFPNAVAEAFAQALPAVGLAATDGVNELIEDGVTGRLSASDVTAFAAALSDLMSDGAKRAAMGAAAVKKVAPYRPSLIFDQWEALFRDVAAQ